MFDPRDPDASLVVRFFMDPQRNDEKSKQAGRPIYEDVEMCEIRIPGNRNYVGRHKAIELSPDRKFLDELTGDERYRTYAERFSRQYKQFKESQVQTMVGTPIALAPFLTEARKAELRAQSVLTIEQLAAIEGQELKNLGPGGRDMKNRAVEYIEVSKQQAPTAAAMIELEAEKAKNRVLAEDLERARKMIEVDSNFDEMNDEQLTALIVANTGRPPIGTLSHKTLVRIAMDTRPARTP